MFLHLLDKDDKLFVVKYHSYTEKHYLKRFKRDYADKQWRVTVDSINIDLSRIKTSESNLQLTQRVDELWQKDNCWIFKYDFRIAQTKESAKSSGNRCIVFLDNDISLVEILIIYGKGDLPKNVGEQAFIEQTLNREFNEYLTKVKNNE